MLKIITKSIPLAQLNVGSSAEIVRVGNKNPNTSFLKDLGFVLGQKITMVKIAPLGDPCELKILGYKLCVRKSELSDIEVSASVPGDIDVRSDQLGDLNVQSAK